MFLISHETKPMCFLSLGPRPGRSYSCLDMVNSADVNANLARPRAPLRKLVSDTENKFAFFPPSPELCYSLLRREAELFSLGFVRLAGRRNKPSSKLLEGYLCFSSLFSFKIQPAKFKFPCLRLKTLAGPHFSAALRKQPGQWSL